jgi:transposase
MISRAPTRRCTNGGILIENFFGKLKEFKRIALRADKTNHSFAAMIHIAAVLINSR